MQDYNTIIGAIQMRLNKCPTRSVMDRFRIGSSTLICFKNPPMRIVKIITMSIQTRWPVMIFLFTLFPSQTIHFHHESYPDFQTFLLRLQLLPVSTGLSDFICSFLSHNYSCSSSGSPSGSWKKVIFLPV